MRNRLLFYILSTLVFASCSSNNIDAQKKGNNADSLKLIKHKNFKESDNTAVFTTKFVIIDNKEITEVYHDDEDGAWQFFSADNFEDLSKVVKIVGLGEITKMDSTLFEIADMPVGYYAHRKSREDKWIIEKNK